MAADTLKFKFSCKTFQTSNRPESGGYIREENIWPLMKLKLNPDFYFRKRGKHEIKTLNHNSPAVKLLLTQQILHIST